MTLARPAIRAMLEARTIALVGASERAGSFGARMVQEVARSAAGPRAYLVNPRYSEISGQPCYRSLGELPAPLDLVLLGVPDTALESQLELAASRGDRSAVIFGNAWEEPQAGRPPLRERLAATARAAGMELCGAGCMGFANVSYGLRAMGYTEPDPLPAGPVALVTHSGSVFSALLRARRAIGFTVAVSAGQELVTAAPSYLRYALELPGTRVLALVLEAMRDAAELRRVLADAAARDIPVVLLAAGGSAAGRALVTAHSGALAAADGGWEALCRAYGVHRAGDLAELADTLELFAAQTRRGRGGPGASRPAGPPARAAGDPGLAAPPAAGLGLATVHDSGLERAHVADLADQLGVRFAPIGDATIAKLAGLLDPGLEPANPLDVWGTGNRTRELFADTLVTLADDPAVGAVALAVDMVPELDGDQAYPQAAADAAQRAAKPVAVLSNLPSALDPAGARRLRAAGVPVLEGTRSGLLALRHLLDHQCKLAAAGQAAASARPDGPDRGTGRDPQARAGERDEPGRGTSAGAAETGHASRPGRAGRARELVTGGQAAGAPLLELLGEYGIATPAVAAVTNAAGAVAAARRIGYPVVLKTDEPGISHKSDAGGVVTGVTGDDQLAATYAGLAARLGPRALVCQQVPAGTELAIGIARDPYLGLLIVVGAGGLLVELLADRAVALPPVTRAQALGLVRELRVAAVLAGARGARGADLDAIATAIAGLSELAADLDDELEALDVNPLICGPAGATAVDALLIRRRRQDQAGRPAPG